MRNLKRALSLAMASIMILGMMVIGAGAVSYDEFSDKDKIVNTEAVNTMVSLGVIDGKADGSYDPTGIVTRAEMAKLIAVMMTGGKNPTLGNITSNFTDTKDHWADAFIAYCANKGIINGRGDGTFGPNEAVTGTAAAKMVLTALGYRSDIEKLTGAEWEINTNVLANKVKLYDGIEAVKPQEGLSRDNTAQMIYNGVQANEVVYRNNYGEYSGVIYAQPVNGVDNDSTVLTTRFQVIKVEGVVEANDVFSVNGNPATTGKIRLTDTNGLVKNATAATTSAPDIYAGSYGVSVDTDLVGKRVVIYVKFQNNLAPNAAASTVIGTPILSDKNVVVETNGKLKDATKVKDALKGSGIAVAANSGSGSNTVYGTREILVTEDKTGFGPNDGTLDAGVTATKGGFYPGIQQTFIDHNNDGKVDYVIQIMPGLSKVTVYNDKDKKMTLSGMKSVDFVDISNPEDVAKDDYVLVAKYDDTYVLTKAESVTGKVTAFDSANDKISVDGKAYAVGAGKNLAADLDSITGASDMTDMVDGSYTLYLDTFGNVLGYTEDEAAIGSYAIITASTNSGSTGFDSGKVKLLMSDGTSGTYEVNLLASAKKWDTSVIPTTDSNSAKESKMAAELGNNKATGTIVSYTLDGSTVTIGQPSYTNTTKYGKAVGDIDPDLQSSRSAYTIGGKSVMADNSTVFFIKDKNNDYTAVAGLNNLRSSALVITGTANKVVYYTAKSGGTMVAKAVYAETSDQYTSNKNFAYIIDTYTKTTEGNNTIYSYPAVLEDGKLTTLKSKTDDGLKSGYVYAYDLSNGGYATFVENNRTINGKAITDSGKYAVAVTIDTNTGAASTSYPLNSKTQVWNVVDADVTDTGSVYTTSMSVNDKVAIVLDSDGNISSAFVRGYLSGNMTTAPGGKGVTTSGSGTLVMNGDTNNTDLAVNGTGVTGGSYNWKNAANRDILSLNLNMATGQSADVAMVKDVNGVKTTTTLATGATDSQTLPAYTATGTENGTVLTITATIKNTDTNKTEANRVITYVVNIGATKASVPSPILAAETAVTKTGTGATGVAAATIEAYVATTDAGYANAQNYTYTANGMTDGDSVSLKLDAATGVSMKITNVEMTGGLKTITGNATGLAADDFAVGKYIQDNTATELYVMDAVDKNEQGTIKVTVKFEESGKLSTEVTYTFVINHNQNIFTIDVKNVGETPHYAGETVTLTGTANQFTKLTKEDGTLISYVASNGTYTMPTHNVKGEAGYVSVTAANATVAKDGVAIVTSVPANTYLKAGEKVTATVTVAVGQTPGGSPATATIGITGTSAAIANGVAVSASDIITFDGAAKTLLTKGTAISTTVGTYTFEITAGSVNTTVTTS